jgi:hypothetical protein
LQVFYVICGAKPDRISEFPPEIDALASTDDKAEALEQVKILVEAVTKLLPLITKFFGF